MNQPLFISNAVIECDGCGRETEIWTDGIRAFASDGWFDADGYEREGSLVTVHCGYVNQVNDEHCAGTAVLDLAEAPWTVADEKALGKLDLGEEIEK